MRQVRQEAKTSLKCFNNEKWTSHVKGLVQQGHFLDLASAQHEDILWKTHMFDLKQGTLKFILNASLDTLPTEANLVKWNKETSDKCSQCKCKETTSHMLNGCRTSLDKYLRRHNTVINYITPSIDTAKFKVYVDLPRHTADGGGTILADICVRSSDL